MLASVSDSYTRAFKIHLRVMKEIGAFKFVFVHSLPDVCASSSNAPWPVAQQTMANAEHNRAWNIRGRDMHTGLMWSFLRDFLLPLNYSWLILFNFHYSGIIGEAMKWMNCGMLPHHTIPTSVQLIAFINFELFGFEIELNTKNRWI